MAIFTSTQINSEVFEKGQQEYGGIPYYELRPYLDSMKLRPPALQVILAFNEQTDPHSFRLFLGEKYGTRLYTPDTLPDPIMTRFLLARLRTKHFQAKNSSRSAAVSRLKATGKLLLNIARFFPTDEMPKEDKETGWFLGDYLFGDDPEVYEAYNLILPLPLLDESLGEQIEVNLKQMMEDLHYAETETNTAKTISSRSSQLRAEQMAKINKLLEDQAKQAQADAHFKELQRKYEASAQGLYPQASQRGEWWYTAAEKYFKK